MAGIVGWRAWFVDDVAYTSRDTDPPDMPDDGCLYVVAYLDSESPWRQLHSGYGTYLWWDGPHGLVIGGNEDSVEENARRYPGATLVRGQWTSPDHMDAVRDRALAAEAP